MVPPPKKFSELFQGEDLSFKIKIEAMIEKLKKMEPVLESPANFDNLMHNFISKTKEKNQDMKMGEKVEAVNSLVELFIKGNAMRAKQMKKDRLKTTVFPSLQPNRHFTDLINGDLFEEPQTTKSYDFIVGSGLRNQGILPKEKQNPLLSLLKPSNNDQVEKNQFEPPKKEILKDVLQKPEEFQEDLLNLPLSSQNSIIEQVMEMSNGNMDIIEKLAPLTVERNPLLRILNPSNNDKYDKENLNVPDYKQDPLLKQLSDHAEMYSEDFLQLPQEKQDEVIDLLEEENPSFNRESLLSDNTERNPLKRLLKPNNRDEYDKTHFLPPAYRQDPLLRQLINHPQDYNEDFLELPIKLQNKVIEVLDQDSDMNEKIIEKLTEIEKNPLLRLTEPDFRDELEKDLLKVPSYNQDPLLNQLTDKPEDYSEDFLNLPLAKQDVVIEVISEIDTIDADKLAPAKIERNPLMRMLSPNNKDARDKQNLVVPSPRQDPLLRQLATDPMSFQDDFLELPRQMRVTLVQLLKESGARRNVIDQLQKLNLDDLPSLKELFSITNKSDLRRTILKVLKEKPGSYARIFSQMFNHQNLKDFMHTKEEIEIMIQDDVEAVAKAFTELILAQQGSTSSLESSTPKLPLTSLFTTLKPQSTEPTQGSKSIKKVKVLSQIIKKPKDGNKVKNANFSKDKIEKLRQSVLPEGTGEDNFSSKTVYKTQEGRIIPTENIKFDDETRDNIIFPDKRLKLIKNPSRGDKPRSTTEAQR